MVNVCKHKCIFEHFQPSFESPNERQVSIPPESPVSQETPVKKKKKDKKRKDKERRRTPSPNSPVNRSNSPNIER